MLDGISLNLAIISFCFLLLFALVRLYGKQQKNCRELYELYLELGHEVFEEEIKKPMELYYLHNTHDSSNVICMSSLNTFDTNDMQSYKLGDATFYEEDLFSPQVLMRKFILMILCLLSMMIIVMTLIL